MKSPSLPATTWIAAAFAAVLFLAIGSVRYFQIPAGLFMAPAFWWLDISGLAASLTVSLMRGYRPVVTGTTAPVEA